MNEKDGDGTQSRWEKAIREQLEQKQDPVSFQQKIVKILLDMVPAPEPNYPRAKDEKAGMPSRSVLGIVFGDSVRVKILETLLLHPESWFNLKDMADLAGVGKTSAKRIVDEMLDSGTDLIEESGDTSKERLIKLKDGVLKNELLFFYVKLRGIL
ncbi:MAG: hypothetical protein ACTSUE_03500 [Promethearchaeota archaeon]